MSIRIEHDLNELERLFDLLFTVTDEPVVKFGFAGMTARNMDTPRNSAYTLEAPREFFYDYLVEKEAFGYFSDRQKVKGVIRALRAAGKLRASMTSRNNDLLLDETKIGQLEPERKDFDFPALKLEFANRIVVDGRSFKRFLAAARKAHADNVGFAWIERERKHLIHAFNEDVSLDYTEYIDREIVADSVTAFKIYLVEQFLPPTIFLRRGYPHIRILGARAYFMPIAINFLLAGTVDFTGYSAPNYESYRAFMAKLGMLKKLTEDAILDVVRRKAPESVSSYEIEHELTGQGYDVEELEKLLRKLVEEKRLIYRESGWKKYYNLPEQPPKLKPLTEEAVLNAIRELCEALQSDSVGFSELEGYLGRDYDTQYLHEMLRVLKQKGLVESKPWPNRPGGYAVDMRGYWAVKPTEPEQAVSQAEEMERLRELTKDAVLSVIRAMNEELNTGVSFDDITGRLRDEGYDVTKLSEILAELKEEDKVWVSLDGKWWIKELKEKAVGPPVPEGYAKVRFLRDMVRFVGMDRRTYGPFKAGEEAIIEKPFAEAFEKAGYVQIITQQSTHGFSSTHHSSAFHNGSSQFIIRDYEEAGIRRLPI